MIEQEVKKVMSRRVFMGGVASSAFAFAVVASRMLGNDVPSKN